MQKLPKERLPKSPIWISIEKSGFSPHGGNNRPVSSWCNPFRAGPPNRGIQKTMFWCNMLKIIPQICTTNSGNGKKPSSWGNPETAPPLVSMALDLVSTLQRLLQGRTKV